MLLILFGIVLVFIVIAYYNAKNKYLEAHPEKIKMYKCSICGREFPQINKLADGAICDECATINGDDWSENLFLLGSNVGSKHTSVVKVKQVIKSWDERKQLLENMTVTRTSESGKILVDDNQKIFCIKNDGKIAVPHKISDVRDFYLEYEYKDTSTISESSSYEVTSGFITINFLDFYNKEEIHGHVDSKLFTQRNEVKKVFESDLVFLEELIGKKRKPIPNKVKIF